MEAQTVIEIPQYQSHKKVWALKLSRVDIHPGPENTIGLNTGTLFPEDTRYAKINVGADYMNRHKPQPGGYYVIYDDGYTSWSPAKAFEEGYTKI